MSATDFSPRLRVHHQRRYPQPILPVDYSYFVRVDLPGEIVSLPLVDQLATVKCTIAQRQFYRLTGPFGDVLAYEFRPSPHVSIYLNPAGEFQPSDKTSTTTSTKPAVG